MPAEPQGKPKNTGMGDLSLLQHIFSTQELNQCLLHCRRILYQLSYQRSLSVGLILITDGAMLFSISLLSGLFVCSAYEASVIFEKQVCSDHFSRHLQRSPKLFLQPVKAKVLVAQVSPNSVNQWTVACQAPLSKEFSRQEYWSGLPFHSPGDLPNPGIEPRSPAWQADSLLSEPPPVRWCFNSRRCFAPHLMKRQSLLPHSLNLGWPRDFL